MSIGAKRSLLGLCKWLGLFFLAGIFYRKRLHILCYHGFSYEDEHEFAPGLFMHPDNFAARISWLQKKKFNVLSLDEGVERLAAGTLPARSVVITADDGFRSIGELAVPITEAANMPFTIYVTTYYLEKGTPIFRLVMQYMAWKAKDADTRLAEIANATLANATGKNPASEPIWQLIDYAEAHMSEEQRLVLCRQVGEALGINYDEISSKGLLTLMTETEIKALADRGIDIQLHTHRHNLPEDPDLVRREISQNRECLEPLAGRKLAHFCYPSGIWSRAHWPTLEALGIKSATTCEPGMVTADTPRLALNRFLDRDNISQIEFEAELSGFKELARSIRQLIRGRFESNTALAAEGAGQRPRG